MDWLQFFAAIVNSIAWPVAVVVVTFVLRAPLGKLLPLIRSFKYKGVEIGLSTELDDIKGKVTAESTAQLPPADNANADISELADIDARGAIFASWILLERELRELGKIAGIGPWRNVLQLGHLLHVDGYMDDLTFEAFDRLRKIRNEAIHLSDRQISRQEAVTMSQLCSWVVAQLRNQKLNQSGET